MRFPAEISLCFSIQNINKQGLLNRVIAKTTNELHLIHNCVARVITEKKKKRSKMSYHSYKYILICTLVQSACTDRHMTHDKTPTHTHTHTEDITRITMYFWGTMNTLTSCYFILIFSYIHTHQTNGLFC